MKKYLLIALVSTLVYAKEDCSTSKSANEVKEQLEIKTDVPNFLKGAKIIVRLADGRESEVPAEAFKVVPRKQQFIVTKVESNSVTMCSNVTDKNRVSLLAGYGAKEGLNKSVSPSQVDVESRTGAVGGLQYQRVIKDGISVGVQGQTNKTGSVMVGIDF